MLDERTERLISRRLDGELDDAESLELDKRLIRSPQTRMSFEESRRLDGLASETLHALLDSGTNESLGAPDSPFGIPSEVQTGLRAAAGRRTRRLLDAAIGVAAAVVLVMVSTSLLPSRQTAIPPLQPNSPVVELAGAERSPSPMSSLDQLLSPALTEVIAGPRHRHERIDQDVIGVVDPETQSVYLLEIQQARNTLSRVRANY